MSSLSAWLTVKGSCVWSCHPIWLPMVFHSRPPVACQIISHGSYTTYWHRTSPYSGPEEGKRHYYKYCTGWAKSTVTALHLTLNKIPQQKSLARQKRKTFPTTGQLLMKTVTMNPQEVFLLCLAQSLCWKILLEAGGELQQGAPQLSTLPTRYIWKSLYSDFSSLRARIKAYSESVRGIGPIAVIIF